MGDPGFLIILVLAFGALFLMTSRTRKQQKEAMTFRASLEPGQEVMTGSGLFGRIVAVDGDIVTLETSPGVTSRWLRPAIAKPVDPVEPTEPVEDGTTDVDLTKGGVTDDVRPVVPDDASSLTDRDDGEKPAR